MPLEVSYPLPVTVTCSPSGLSPEVFETVKLGPPLGAAGTAQAAEPVRTASGATRPTRAAALRNLLTMVNMGAGSPFLTKRDPTVRRIEGTGGASICLG